MRNFKTLVLILFGIITLSSCMKENDNAYDNIRAAGLTMINAYTKSEHVMHYLDNRNVQSTPLPYNSIDYANVFPGNRRLRIASENNATLIDTMLSIQDTIFYTSIVYNYNDAAKIKVAKDLGLKDLASNAAIRFFHVSPLNNSVNVYLDDTQTAFYENVAPEGLGSADLRNNDDFKKVSSGAKKIIITDRSGNKLIERDYDFKAQKYYSILLVGEKDSATKPLRISIAEQY